MTKYEKIAIQCAKHDIKRGMNFGTYKELKLYYLSLFKKLNYSTEKAADYKNWVKSFQ